MADVFVCYNRGDLDFVQPFVRVLRGAGLTVWWDHEMPPDAPWEATTERELMMATTVIVVWSEQAVASEMVKAEARRARQLGKLIQVFFGACEPPLFFGERQGVDFSGWKGAAKDPRIETVLAAVRAVMAGGAPAKGVGWAPPRRKRDWRPLGVLGAVLLAAMGLAAFLVPMDAIACRLGLADCPAEPVQPSPAPALGDRAALLSRMAGDWGNAAESGAPACQTIVRYEVEQRAGEDIVVLSQPGGGWRSEGVVVGSGAKSIFTRTISANEAGAQWELRLESDQLVQVDSSNIATVLVRCGGGR